jgi:hypothetical protein
MIHGLDDRFYWRTIMSLTTNEVLGVVRADGSLELSSKLTVPPGRVRVRIDSLEPPTQSDESLIEFVARTRHERDADGHRFRTKEEIDAELEEQRNEWDERLDELNAPQESPAKKE